jgi:hypothetical protein
LVLAHLRKERFPRGEYNKMKLKKIGPCRNLRKFSFNAYEIELPSDIEISPIFNVFDLYPFKGENEVPIDAPDNVINQTIYWEQPLPTIEKAD